MGTYRLTEGQACLDKNTNARCIARDVTEDTLRITQDPSLTHPFSLPDVSLTHADAFERLDWAGKAAPPWDPEKIPGVNRNRIRDRYPWDLWLNGEQHAILCLVGDVPSTPASLRVMASNKAADRNLALTTRRRGATLYLRAYPLDAPKPRLEIPSA